MKKIIRPFLLNSITLAVLAYLFPGVDYSNSIHTLIVAAIVLVFLNFLVKPLLKILFLPLNLLTMGIFRWIINVAILFLATVLVPDFTISAFTIPSTSIFNLTFPALTLSDLWSLVFISFFYSLTRKIITSTL